MCQAPALGTVHGGARAMEVLRNKGVGHGVVAVLICVLSSVPLAQLSRKAASILAVLLSALLTIVQRMKQRQPLPAGDEREQLAFKDAHGTRHEVRHGLHTHLTPALTNKAGAGEEMTLRPPVPTVRQVYFLGDEGVGKTSLIDALRAYIPSNLRESTARGLTALSSSTQSADALAELRGAADVRRHAVIVWTANLPETMRAYATRWRSSAVAACGGHVPTLVVCNMTDVAPCPLPEMNAMRGTKIPALAVSAARGTNIGALWLLIERSINTAPKAASAATPSSRAPIRTAGAQSARDTATAPPATAPVPEPPGTSVAQPLRTHGSTPSPASVIPTGAFGAMGDLTHVSSHEMVDSSFHRQCASDTQLDERFEHDMLLSCACGEGVTTTGDSGTVANAATGA